VESSGRLGKDEGVFCIFPGSSFLGLFSLAKRLGRIAIGGRVRLAGLLSFRYFIVATMPDAIIPTDIAFEPSTGQIDLPAFVAVGQQMGFLVINPGPRSTMLGALPRAARHGCRRRVLFADASAISHTVKLF